MIKLTSVLFAVGAALIAGASAEVVATQSVEKEIVVRDESGVETTSRIKAEKVTPGETVVYTLHYVNEADRAADDMVLVMPVPPEIAYVEGSIEGAAATATFSADGGQTYVGRGRLTVVENGAERPAKGDEITHIKWTLTTPVPPRGKGEVSYKGVLR